MYKANSYTVKNNPSRFHVKLRNPHLAYCICENPQMDAKIRILYELLIITIIGISQMHQSCADFGVWHAKLFFTVNHKWYSLGKPQGWVKSVGKQGRTWKIAAVYLTLLQGFLSDLISRQLFVVRKSSVIDYSRMVLISSILKDSYDYTNLAIKLNYSFVIRVKDFHFHQLDCFPRKRPELVPIVNEQEILHLQLELE